MKPEDGNHMSGSLFCVWRDLGFYPSTHSKSGGMENVGEKKKR